jgi:hypothetical protein
VVESAEMFIHRSPVVTLAFKHLMKLAIHDLNKRDLFAIVFTSSAFTCGRSNSLFACNQPQIRDMLEYASLNLFGLCDLGQVQWEIL